MMHPTTIFDDVIVDGTQKFASSGQKLRGKQSKERKIYKKKKKSRRTMIAWVG